MKSLLLAIILVTTVTSGFAKSDSIFVNKPETKHFLKHQFVPFSLITAGAMLNIGNIKETLNAHIPKTNNPIDNYIQYVPAAEMYLLDAFGLKHKNNAFDQTKYLLISQLTAAIVVHTLKNTTNVTRPNGGPTSYPSGHTTTAFVCATVLFREFKETDSWLAYSGFVVATATGCLRMTNNAHWLPDVVTGAGIGILSVNMVYLLEPLKKLQLSSGKKKVAFIPMVGYKSFALACNF